MDDTHSSQTPMQQKSTQAPSIAYLAIGLTLVVALMQLWGSLHGKPTRWPSLALLITLFCASMGSIVQSKRVKMILSMSGIIFAIATIYGLLTTR